MIEIHFHCLPRVDDGPASWNEAVSLCRAAAAEGTTRIVATPHVLRGGWANTNPVVRDRLIQALNERLGGNPRVLAGCEYYYSEEVISLAKKGPASPLTGLARGHYLLIEFGPGHVPPSIMSVFHELRVLGVHPIIAHPERHLVFARQPERLAELVTRGALVQITAGSFLGDFGRTAQKACQDFFRLGLVHAIASDAHSVSQRPPRMAPARERIRKKWGPDAEHGLFVENPEAILASRPVPFTNS
ncbi:MAG: tyrosine-protein phosphatase [Acidobacteriota bacterium]